MTTEFDELLSRSAAKSSEERSQIWLIGSRDQVEHLINECYVRRMASDRAQFSPIIPVPIIPGKFMSVLMR